MPCELTIESDPRVLEQILRNLLPNASKYTRHGKVLLGCRRAGTLLRIELCGPGIGVPGNEQKAIFDEYCQLENPARERERGLGLAIARRTAAMLGHRITLQSRVSGGSIFGFEVALPRGMPPAQREAVAGAASEAARSQREGGCRDSGRRGRPRSA